MGKDNNWPMTFPKCIHVRIECIEMLIRPPPDIKGPISAHKSFKASKLVGVDCEKKTKGYIIGWKVKTTLDESPKRHV